MITTMKPAKVKESRSQPIVSKPEAAGRCIALWFARGDFIRAQAAFDAYRREILESECDHKKSLDIQASETHVTELFTGTNEHLGPLLVKHVSIEWVSELLQVNFRELQSKPLFTPRIVSRIMAVLMKSQFGDLIPTRR